MPSSRGLLIGGTVHIARRKSRAKGGVSKARNSATWSDASRTILVAWMNGKPRMVLTDTLGPHATRREVGCPSRIRYGMWNWNEMVRSVVTDAPPCWTIPLNTIGLWSAALKMAATVWGNAFAMAA